MLFWYVAPSIGPRRSSAGDGRCIRILHAPVCWAVDSALENKKADIPKILNHKGYLLNNAKKRRMSL